MISPGTLALAVLLLGYFVYKGWWVVVIVALASAIAFAQHARREGLPLLSRREK